MMLILPAAGRAEDSISLIVTGSATGTMPNGVTLSFEVEGPSDAYPISVAVMDHSYGYLAGCTNDCSVTVLTGVLDGGSQPLVETLHIRAYGYGGPTSPIVDKTVTLQPPNWHVALSMPEEVTVPDPFPARIDVGPQLFVPQSVQLIDPNNGSWMGMSCAPTTGSCEANLPTPGWITAPMTQDYRAQLKDGSITMAADSKTVTFYPPSIGPKITAPSLVLPGHTYTIKITNFYNQWTPWLIVVRDRDGNLVGTCHVDDTNCEFTITAGSEGTSQIFTAAVKSGPTTVSSSSAATIFASDPSNGGAGGSGHPSIGDLAGLFGSAAAVCQALLYVPGTHVQQSSLTDQELACQEVAQAGGSADDAIRAALAALAAVGSVAYGGSILDSLLGYAWINYGDNGPPANPTAPPADPPANPPVSTPAPVTTEIGGLASVLQGRSSGLTVAEATDLARRCLYLVAAAQLLGKDLCDTLPIFSPGSNHNEATQHRIDALDPTKGGYPGWVLLHRRAGARDRWYVSQPECEGSTELFPCDEFPENRTYEGGSLGAATVHRPSLKIINRAANSGLGGSLIAFFTACGVTDGQAYLVIPTPVALGKPTTKVC